MKNNKSFFIIFSIVLLYSCIEKFPQGKNLYENYCANCHMSDGKGLANLYPPLADSDYMAINREIIACVIRFGLKDTILVNGQTFDIPMEGIKKLNDIEINNIINYIFNAWGNNLGIVSIDETRTILERCNN